MARMLIVYGTTDGQTAKIARFIAGVGRGEGHEIVVVDACSREARLDLSAYDGVVVGASVHFSRHRREVCRWIREHRARLSAMPSAFFQVSLSAAVRDPAHEHRDAESIAHLTAKTGWRPERSASFAGALAYTRYRLWKKLLTLAAARVQRLSTDFARDHEYTDWSRVRTWSQEFFASVPERSDRARNVRAE